MDDPRIETRGAFTVVGLQYRGPADSDEFSGLWRSLDERWSEFERCGAAFDPGDSGAAFEHWIPAVEFVE